MKKLVLKLSIISVLFLLILSGINPLLGKKLESNQVYENFNDNISYSGDEKSIISKYTPESFEKTLDLNDLGYVSGEVVVKFKSDVFIDPVFNFNNEFQSIGISSIDNLCKKHNVVSVKNIFYDEGIKNLNDLELSKLYKFKIPRKNNIFSLLQDLNNDANVDFAEPNYIYQIYNIPNDPRFSDQWGLDHIDDYDVDAPEAWDIVTGNSDVNIAVIDTGIDYNHEDLKGNIWDNIDEIPDNSIDDDGNDFIDDNRGWDFVDIDTDYYVSQGFELFSEEDYIQDDNNPIDIHSHGTHCAGIIGGFGNNGIGISGVCWDCSVMPVRAGFKISYNGYIYGISESDDIANAIYYAANNGADVISMSFGSTSESSIVKNALDYAYNSGVVLVAAAGNSNSNKINYPAGHDVVIAVAATDKNNEKASFSNYGSWVDVAAPGVDIVSTYLDNRYNISSGTSMACPHVAGLAGLILSKNNAFSNQEIKNILRSSTDIVSSSKYIGLGRINAYNSILRESILIADFDSTIDNQVIHGMYDVIGTASGENFDRYELYYGSGLYPSSWNKIGSTHYDQVVDDVLATWDTNSISGGLFTIKLIATDTDSQITEDRAIIAIDNMMHNGWPINIEMNVGNTPVIADLDSDGKKEIIVCTSGNIDTNEEVYVWKENGELMEGWPKSFDAYTTRINAGDIDDDGYLEIVCSTNNEIFAWEYNGSSLSGWPKNYHYRGHTLSDINNDDCLDIIHASGGYLRVYDYKGNYLPGWPEYLGRYTSAQVVGNVDNDNEKEIVVYYKYKVNDVYEHYITVLNSTGVVENGWPKQIQALPQFNNPLEAIVLGDIDNDEILEIIVGDKEKLYVFNGDGTSPPGWSFERSTAFLYPPVLSDLDGDGKIEIIEAYKSFSPTDASGEINVYKNDGTIYPGFPIQVFDFEITSSPFLADLDNNGNQEIIISCVSGLLVYNIDGDLLCSFTSYSDFPSFRFTGSLTSAIDDIDNDGFLEVVFVSMTGVVHIWDLDNDFGFLSWPQYQHDAQHTGLYIFSQEDRDPPKADIIKPVKALYIMNVKIRNFLFRKPLIIGKINITVDANDDLSGINYVEFYIDDDLIFKDTNYPYYYFWKHDKISPLKHRHKIKIVVYDNSRNSATDEITVWRFL